MCLHMLLVVVCMFSLFFWNSEADEVSGMLELRVADNFKSGLSEEILLLHFDDIRQKPLQLVFDEDKLELLASLKTLAISNAKVNRLLHVFATQNRFTWM